MPVPILNVVPGYPGAQPQGEIDDKPMPAPKARRRRPQRCLLIMAPGGDRRPKTRLKSATSTTVDVPSGRSVP